ncbi:MAG: peptidoglycan DD-metalloendopeptidase family protein [Deinococcaceae bacterium]
MVAHPEREWLVTRAVPKKLLALGVPSLDLETLERSAMAFLSDAATLRRHGLKGEAIERWLDVISRIPSWVECLSRQNIPLRLIHGDFYPMNVFWMPTGPKYFDWSDACIAHPWLDAGRLFNWTFFLHKNAKHFTVPKGVSAYNRLKCAYLLGWDTTDEDAFECARLLSVLFHDIRGDLFLRIRLFIHRQMRPQTSILTELRFILVWIANGRNMLRSVTLLGSLLLCGFSLASTSKVHKITVKNGDSFYKLSKMYRVPEAEIAKANHKTLSSVLHLGEVLIIPNKSKTPQKQTKKVSASGVWIVVKPKDRLYHLARTYGVPEATIAKANGLPSTHVLRAGTALYIPQGSKFQTNPKLVKASKHPTAHQKRLERVKDLGSDGARKILERRWELQKQYEAYIALKNQKRQILNARYVRQAKYERYLALKAKQRRILTERYRKQAKYEAYLAARKRVVAQTRGQVRHVSLSSRYVSVSNPVRRFRVTDDYGWRNFSIHGNHFHTGIDMAAPSGTPVYAASSGHVSASGWGSYGIGVFVKQNNAEMIYGHLSRAVVRPGQRVNRGDLIGFVGCTGICTGPHLHFEVRIGGRHIDPERLLP